MRPVGLLFSWTLTAVWLLTGEVVRALPVVSGWPAGDGHLHSTYSDGNSSIAVMAATSRDRGLQWIYMTDHAPFFLIRNWNAYVAECQAASTGILVIPGSEFGLTNHYLGYGLQSFRATAVDSCQGLIDYVASLGGFGYIAHPDSPDFNWDDWNVTGYAGIEVWNGASSCEYLWDELLRQGKKVLAVGNTDAHSPGSLGSPFMYVKAGLVKEEIQEALRTGRVVMTRGPFINFKVGPAELGETAGIVPQVNQAYLLVEWAGDGQLRYIRILRVDQEAIQTVATVDVNSSQSPVELLMPVGPNCICFRLQGLSATGQVVALTNPIWLKFLASGDINQDDSVNVADVLICLAMVLRKRVSVNDQMYPFPYPSWLVQAADLNGDGLIDINDVVAILRIIMLTGR